MSNTKGKCIFHYRLSLETFGYTLILGENIYTIKPQKLLTEVGLEVNTEKMIANKFFENVSKFNYMGMAIRNEIYIQKEIKSIQNSENACYHSIQNILSFLSKILKIRIQKTVILPAVLRGCETLPLTLREEQRWRVSEESIWT
jgi:hypothetical protein